MHDSSTYAQRTEYMTCFKEYETLVDNTLSEFIKKERTDMPKLLTILQKSSDEDEFVKAVIDMVVAAAEYRTFAVRLTR